LLFVFHFQHSTTITNFMTGHWQCLFFKKLRQESMWEVSTSLRFGVFISQTQSPLCKNWNTGEQATVNLYTSMRFQILKKTNNQGSTYIFYNIFNYHGKLLCNIKYHTKSIDLIFMVEDIKNKVNKNYFYDCSSIAIQLCKCMCRSWVVKI